MDQKDEKDSTLVDRQSSQRIYRLIQRKDFALHYLLTQQDLDYPAYL